MIRAAMKGLVWVKTVEAQCNIVSRMPPEAIMYLTLAAMSNMPVAAKSTRA